MNKANKTMTKFTFDTYDSLRKQVYDRIIDYIDTGKVDGIDLNDPLRVIELNDSMVKSDIKLYCGAGNYEKMQSVLGDIFGFKRLFSSLGRKLDVTISAWQLIVLSVFIEHYHEFKEIWNKRMTSNG